MNGPPPVARLPLLASAIWVLVGIMLLARSVPMFAHTGEQWGTGGAIATGLAAAILGAGKGRFVLTKRARQNRRRIESLAAPRPWQVFTPTTWLLVLGMILLGVGLRAAANAGVFAWGVVAAIYAGVGVALCVSSRGYFAAIAPPLPTRSDAPPATRTAKRGVLVVNLGTPDAPTKPAVRRYLREFLGDRRVVEAPRWLWFFVLRCIVLPLRAGRSAHAYGKVWTAAGSPLLVHSRAFAAALQCELGDDFAVALAMRYGNPSLQAGLDELRRQGVDEVVVAPLFPQWSNTTTGTIQLAAAAAAARWRNPPALQFLGPMCTDPGYIAALAARIEQTRGACAIDFFVFSYHGLPESYVAGGDPYLQHCTATSWALAQALALPRDRWEMVFQSRFGDQPWLRPYADEFVTALAKTHRRVLIVLPAFATDCLETLEEIGIALRAAFRAAGGEELLVAPSLNDHPAWVAAVAARVRAIAAPAAIGVLAVD